MEQRKLKVFPSLPCLLLLIMILYPAAAAAAAADCSYPDLAQTCEDIVTSRETGWRKVNMWKTVLFSLDLNTVECAGDMLDNHKKVITVTSADEDSLFEFNYAGSVDQDQKFAGKGN